MENANNKKGSFMGLLPLVIFLVVYFAMGIGTGDFGNFPLMIGIFLASGISLFMKSPVAEKKSFTEKMVMFCKGGGDDTLILMVIIYMLAGAFYGVASGMHATDTVTNIGISILPANMILPGLFLIGCILSFSMGTSMGTVAALMPIGIDIASKTGVSVALVSGIVVGGECSVITFPSFLIQQSQRQQHRELETKKNLKQTFSWLDLLLSLQ